MPDCQSGAARPKAAAPVPVSLRMATNRFCQADCHGESCGNALYDVACSNGTSARLFPGERDGRGLAQRSVPRGEVAAVQRERSIVCRSGQMSRVGIHHSGSDRASRRTLIALGEEPPRKWRSLKGSGYLGRCCQRQRSVRQFFIPVRKDGQASRPKRAKSGDCRHFCRHALGHIMHRLSPVSPVSSLL